MSERPPDPRPWTHVSPSQVATWKRCPRRHFFEKRYGVREPPSKAMERGLLVHKQLERWLKYEEPPTDPCALAALEHLPDPGEVKLEQVEHPFMFRHAMLPVPFKGVIDLLLPDEIEDHKTTSDFRYVKDEAVLREDPQAIGYGWYAVKELNYSFPLRVRLLYMRTRKPERTRNSIVIWEREELAEACKRLANIVHQMAQTMEKVHPADVRPNGEDCYSYGRPCPNLNRCLSIGDIDPLAGTPLEGLGKKTQTNDEKEKLMKLKDMVDAKKAKAKKDKKKDNDEPLPQLEGLGAAVSNLAVEKLLDEVSGEHQVTIDLDTKCIRVLTTGKAKKVVKVLDKLMPVGFTHAVVEWTPNPFREGAHVDEQPEEEDGAMLLTPTSVQALLDGVKGEHNIEIDGNQITIRTTSTKHKKVLKALGDVDPFVVVVVTVDGVNPPDGVKEDAEEPAAQEPATEEPAAEEPAAQDNRCPAGQITVPGYPIPVGKLPKIGLEAAHADYYKTFRSRATGDQFRRYMDESVPWNKPGGRKPIMSEWVEDVGLMRDILADSGSFQQGYFCAAYEGPADIRVLWSDADDAARAELRTRLLTVFPNAAVKVK